MRTHRFSNAVAVAATLLVAAAVAPARAEPRQPQEVSLRVSNQLVTDDGIFATGPLPLTQGELSYARGILAPWRGTVWLEGSWTLGARTGYLFANHDTTTFLQQITAGVRYSVPLLRWLVPHVRLGLGALVGHIFLRDSVGGNTGDWSGAFTGYALGGVELLIPRAWMRDPDRRGFTMGLVVEGGYAFSTALAFHLVPEQSDDRIHTPLGGTDVGGLSLDGAVIRAGIVARF